jgi:hypothetical protein
MKAPSIGIDKEAVLDFLLGHGEKVVGAVVGLGALWLAWGGIDALQSKSVKPDQRPEAILARAGEARNNIDREKTPPPQERWPGPPLTATIDPWRSPEVAPPPAGAMLNKPLFEERAKRSQPAVFPIEDLRAVAGLAVLPPGKTPPGDPQQPQPQPPQQQITPYVVVTGLIPVAKQRAEYRQRFAEAQFPQPDRDAPVWSDWIFERSVGPGFERWERIDPATMTKRQGEWAGIATDKVPDAYRLAASEEKPVTKEMPPYCGPLPQLARGGWGAAALHPWVIEHIRKQQPAATAEYRMFRFIDTDVAVGKSYRYRVQFALANPNLNVEDRYLADPATAKKPFLVAASSKESTPVTVPDETTLLVDVLRKAEPRRKTSVFEVLVLAPSVKSGGYALRGLVTEPGGLINVDEKLNKPGDRRTRGEEVRTDHVLLDVRGRQEDRTDARSGPPEPFEVLCLRDDGTFELVSAADSETEIAEHKSTLPADDTGKGETTKPGQKDPNAGKPPTDPLFK